MRVLAFDACLEAVTAAAGVVRRDGSWERGAGEFMRVSGGHAEALMPMIDRVMRSAGMVFPDLDRLVTTLGPGGFTGVRVAVAAARGFLLATSARGVGLSTLDALAIGARREIAGASGEPLAVAVDGRRGMVFFALYASGSQEAVPALLTVAEAAAQVRGKTSVIVGSASEAVAAEAGDAGAFRCLAQLQPDAREFGAQCAYAEPAAVLQPIYLRPPDAKAQTSFVLPRAPA